MRSEWVSPPRVYKNISSEVCSLAIAVVVTSQSDTKRHLEVRGGVKATPNWIKEWNATEFFKGIKSKN